MVRTSMGFLRFLLLLFISLVIHGDCVRDECTPSLASNFDGEMPSSMDYSEELCESCMKITQDSKAHLYSSLPNEVSKSGNLFCSLMPSDLEKKKCETILKIYEHRGSILLQELFYDENFCINKGFCSGNSKQISMKNAGQAQVLSIGERLNDALSKLHEGLPLEVMTSVLNSTISLNNQNSTIELISNGSCNACRNVLDQVSLQLEDPKKQLKLISAIVKACETEIFVAQCKKMVYAYGPIIVTNLQKVVNMDLCHTVHLCEYPRNQTTQELMKGKENHVNSQDLINEVQIE